MGHADLTGQKFGYVTAIRASGKDTQGRLVWLCVCKCGNKCRRAARQLKTGRTVSCGCFFKQRRGGMCDSKSYPIWRSMLQRCRTKSSKSYKHYGGRGIMVCNRWKRFKNFLADMGEKPEGMSIDRINNDGNYEPANCRWATTKEQARNYRKNVKISMNGKTLCVTDWASILKIPEKRIFQRLSMGWSPKAALTHPISIHHPRNGKLIKRK